MKKVVAVLMFLGCLGVASPVLADQSASDGVQCWIPSHQPVSSSSSTLSRLRGDGVWEILMGTGRREAEGLCTEVTPGNWVYTPDKDKVLEYLHGLNGEVKFYGEWVQSTPMLYSLGHIAACESGGKWDAVNGRFGGLLQIDGMSPNAPAQEQLDAAYSIYDRQGWGAWPVCSQRYGLK